jgi:hypothetical protein
MRTLIRRGAIANPSPPEAGEVLRLEPHEDPAALAGRLAHAVRVEVNFPKFSDGRGYSIARLLREHVTVISGLRNKGGESGSPHGITQETWLNAVSPRSRNTETGVGVTVDQIAARHLGRTTPLPSLELCGEPGGIISFRTPEQPLPMEGNPRKVFYSMFGQGDTAKEREAILNSSPR